MRELLGPFTEVFPFPTSYRQELGLVSKALSHAFASEADGAKVPCLKVCTAHCPSQLHRQPFTL